MLWAGEVKNRPQELKARPARGELVALRTVEIFAWREELEFREKCKVQITKCKVMTRCDFAFRILHFALLPLWLRLCVAESLRRPAAIARFDPLEAGCWAALLLECGNSFPLSLPSGRHREDNFPMTKPKRGDKESGDESPHSKDSSTTRTRSGRNSRESIRCPTRSSIFTATR